MGRNNILGVWNEVRISNEGISITLYSESADEVYVEDEMWFTHNELHDSGSNRIYSLRLSQETREIMSSEGLNQYQELEDFLMSETDEYIAEGDIVEDKETPPSWSETNYLKVESVTDIPANQYLVEDATDDYWATTVAEMNPDYPDVDTVVECYYITTEEKAASKKYAFPESRLTPVDPEEIYTNE